MSEITEEKQQTVEEKQDEKQQDVKQHDEKVEKEAISWKSRSKLKPMRSISWLDFFKSHSVVARTLLRRLGKSWRRSISLKNQPNVTYIT